MPIPQTDSNTVRQGQVSLASEQDSLWDELGQSGEVFRFSDEEDTLWNQSASGNGMNPLQGPGLFKGHLLRTVNPNAQPFEQLNPSWFTITLILLLGSLTWFRYFFHKIFTQLVSAFFNTTAANQIVRDESVLLQRASLILSVLSYAMMGLFLYRISYHFHWQIPFFQTGLLRFTLFSLLVALAYSLKMVAVRFLSTIFDQERPAAHYIFILFLMVMMCGLILLPANILLAYAPDPIPQWTLIATFVILTLLFLYRLIKAASIWLSIPGSSIFHLFLYFCAFEIAPLLIIWKVGHLV
jgi:hypothetical protein